MKKLADAPYPRRTSNAIPRSFTITDRHLAYLQHRKGADAKNPSRLIRELIDREIELNPCGFVWGERHDSI